MMTYRSTESTLARPVCWSVSYNKQGRDVAAIPGTIPSIMTRTTSPSATCSATSALTTS